MGLSDLFMHMPTAASALRVSLELVHYFRHDTSYVPILHLHDIQHRPVVTKMIDKSYRCGITHSCNAAMKYSISGPCSLTGFQILMGMSAGDASNAFPRLQSTSLRNSDLQLHRRGLSWNS